MSVWLGAHWCCDKVGQLLHRHTLDNIVASKMSFPYLEEISLQTLHHAEI
jgi:hypothetical protein